MRKKNKTAICINCLKPFPSYYSTSKYCCPKCQVDYQYKEYVKKWLNGEKNGARGGSCTISKHVRRFIFERANSRCEICGFDKTHPRTHNSILQIHHIDEDPTNNRPENLQLLCPNCHALEDSKNTAKGNGRRYYRKQYYKNK